ncbi:LOW QUALITY PROTEIN: phenoloxidase-activating factor 1-like [Labeo rohita]|uniref:LOW QUALITY PROTEIN: phenoloxidase-activating factor 1-like n=1 Tax=Labeo rohita TaxID=84645 RepID=UPI0021E32F64|nr:LOW QUALITY PROTEIN: phenoloxidase-activating factor 1-like [Labeo rohita]
MVKFSLLLLASLLPHTTFSFSVNVCIVISMEAKPHSRPYMVSVQSKEQHICSGFLISDRFVMTAAHCRNKKTALTVVLGAHDLQNKNENSVRIKVESYHPHPQYTFIRESFDNDILLLRLEKNAQLNNNIKPISIPAEEADIKADSVCSIAGWGRLETNGNQSNHFMETNVKVMNNNTCESKWGEGDFSASLMMSAYGYRGSCHGDSGGPLVCGDTAVGVASFGDPEICNSSALPQVYTKISAYLPWIKSITAALVNVNIVNDKEAKPHSRPYMVSVQSKEQHICSGFLISDRFVMTAAHCRNNSPVLTVVLGAHNLRNKKENSVRIKVDSYYQHPKYTNESFHNDILLLKLEKNAQLNNNIKSISIPTKEGDIEADSVCSIAGWGLLETKGKQSNHLMETNVTVMNNKECESKWGEEEFSASLMMCVYGEGGSCTGDSGGPLVCGDTAVGVTSFGDPKICNSPELPEVYTKISAYLPWIKSITGNGSSAILADEMKF